VVIRALAACGVLAATLVACNAVLGWNEPTLAADAGAADSGAPDSGAPDSGDASPGEISCTIYCNLMQQNCTGDLKEYGSSDVCMKMCKELEPGFAGETMTNTVACRQYHAAAAANDPHFHCPHAGPLGGQTCGEKLCDSYCLLDVALCGTRAFASETDCRAACAQFKVDTDAGDLTEESGNTFNCRLYHLEQAYGVSADLHCPHTGVVSAMCY
jgi:hypothetical protein